ncbi:hypothetical protein IVB22_08760 [Bradyrhizobium sp. 190]|nr:hypothetical protein [Bradyrhizobium sp. 190]
MRTFGLTSRRKQSGASAMKGRISRGDDALVRTAL